MENPARWLWDKVGGNALWEAIAGIGKWAWGAGMISSALALTLGWFQSLPWVLLYLYALYAFLLVLMVANEGERRRLQKKLRQGELLLPFHKEAIESAQQKIAEYQAKLTAIEDASPHLTAVVVSHRYTLTYEQHPSPSFGRYKKYRGGNGFFIFLRVTNEPRNNNTRAIAKNLYATVQYYDEHGEELRLFPSIESAWVSLDQKTGAIQYIEHNRNFSLRPHEYRYLAIALRYPWEEPQDCYALNVSNLQYADWIDKSLRLPGKTIIEVTLGCHHFKNQQLYTLNDLGSEKGLSLEPTILPSPSSEEASHFSSKNESV